MGESWSIRAKKKNTIMLKEYGIKPYSPKKNTIMLKEYGIKPYSPYPMLGCHLYRNGL
jgi:hypothetical protein